MVLDVQSIREYQNFPNSYLLFTKVSMHLSISHSLCRRSSRSPIMLSILLVNGTFYFLGIQYIYPFNRRSCPKSSTCFSFSDISIFLRRKCYTRFLFSRISIFRHLCMYVQHTASAANTTSAMDSSALNSSAMDSSAMDSCG